MSDPFNRGPSGGLDSASVRRSLKRRANVDYDVRNMEEGLANKAARFSAAKGVRVSAKHAAALEANDSAQNMFDSMPSSMWRGTDERNGSTYMQRGRINMLNQPGAELPSNLRAQHNRPMPPYNNWILPAAARATLNPGHAAVVNMALRNVSHTFSEDFKEKMGQGILFDLNGQWRTSDFMDRADAPDPGNQNAYTQIGMIQAADVNAVANMKILKQRRRRLPASSVTGYETPEKEARYKTARDVGGAPKGSGSGPGYTYETKTSAQVAADEAARTGAPVDAFKMDSSTGEATFDKSALTNINDLNGVIDLIHSHDMTQSPIAPLAAVFDAAADRAASGGKPVEMYDGFAADVRMVMEWPMADTNTVAYYHSVMLAVDARARTDAVVGTGPLSETAVDAELRANIMAGGKGDNTRLGEMVLGLFAPAPDGEASTSAHDRLERAGMLNNVDALARLDADTLNGLSMLAPQTGEWSPFTISLLTAINVQSLVNEGAVPEPEQTMWDRAVEAATVAFQVAHEYSAMNAIVGAVLPPGIAEMANEIVPLISVARMFALGSSTRNALDSSIAVASNRLSKQTMRLAAAETPAQRQAAALGLSGLMASLDRQTKSIAAAQLRSVDPSVVAEATAMAKALGITPEDLVNYDPRARLSRVQQIHESVYGTRMPSDNAVYTTPQTLDQDDVKFLADEMLAAVNSGSIDRVEQLMHAGSTLYAGMVAENGDSFDALRKQSEGKPRVEAAFKRLDSMVRDTPLYRAVESSRLWAPFESAKVSIKAWAQAMADYAGPYSTIGMIMGVTEQPPAIGWDPELPGGGGGRRLLADTLRPTNYAARSVRSDMTPEHETRRMLNGARPPVTAPPQVAPVQLNPIKFTSPHAPGKPPPSWTLPAKPAGDGLTISGIGTNPTTAAEMLEAAGGAALGGLIDAAGPISVPFYIEHKYADAIDNTINAAINTGFRTGDRRPPGFEDTSGMRNRKTRGWSSMPLPVHSVSEGEDDDLELDMTDIDLHEPPPRQGLEDLYGENGEAKDGEIKQEAQPAEPPAPSNYGGSHSRLGHKGALLLSGGLLVGGLMGGVGAHDTGAHGSRAAQKGTPGTGVAPIAPSAGDRVTTFGTPTTGAPTVDKHKKHAWWWSAIRPAEPNESLQEYLGAIRRSLYSQISASDMVAASRQFAKYASAMGSQQATAQSLDAIWADNSADGPHRRKESWFAATM